MPDISARLRRRIEAEYPDAAATVLEKLHGLDELVNGSLQDPERMYGAVVRLGQGKLKHLDDALSLAREDWRDLLVAAGFANGDWPDRLAGWLGPAE